MTKPAESAFPLHELVRDRWSPLAFDDRPVEPAALGSLFEAARWAASSYNEQPWGFVVARHSDTEAFERLLGCIVEGNQPWAKEAPVLVLSVAKSQFARNGKPNRHSEHDVGLATGNLVLQAMSQGLYCHMMAGFEPQKARLQLGVPEGWEPLVMMAIGYIGDPESLPESYRDRDLAPRQRKPLDEIVFDGRWGESLSFT